MLPLSRLSPYPLETAGILGRERDLAVAAGRLEAALHPAAARALGEAMSGIHSYYSNLIEGPSTHPITAELAAAGRLPTAKEAGDISERYRKQALAGIAASLRMKEVLDKTPPVEVFSSEFIRFLHHTFTSRLPAELRIVCDDEGREDTVVPGKFRTRHVVVGRFVPPEPDELGSLIDAFGQMYRMLGPTIRGAMLLHHRFVWIHPFLDGNGRTARMLTEAMLFRAKVGGAGLWCLSRGLAKRKDEYLKYLTMADTARKGDYDGRGQLSLEASEQFVTFMLDVALDQTQFMLERLATDNLLRRTEQFCKERETVLGRDPRAFALLKEALLAGPFERGRAGELMGLATRTASDIVRDCLNDKVLTSPSAKGLLYPGFPMYSLAYLFPHLFPVDNPEAAMRDFCTGVGAAPLASEIAEAEMPEQDDDGPRF
jgi:Fic family protein